MWKHLKRFLLLASVSFTVMVMGTGVGCHYTPGRLVVEWPTNPGEVPGKATVVPEADERIPAPVPIFPPSDCDDGG